MATSNAIERVCGKCGQKYSTKAYSLVSSLDDPDITARLSNGELFVAECPHCGNKELQQSPFVYHDAAQKVFIAMMPENVHMELPEGYSGRLVTKVGDLIEKVKILQAGLDDVAIEMCKFVTLRELGKDVELKFVSLNGSDNEIVMTYPEKGEMQMIGIGLNVYEDSSRILQRNPSVHESIKGFAVIDQAWLAQFFR